jgi:O-antigen/teichoic acid export membrane protein
MIGKLSKKLSSGNKTIAFVTISNLIGNIAAIISGLIIARWMLPEELGLFNALSIFSSYIILTQLGIPSGLSRELPFNYGQKKVAYAHELAATAKYSMIALSFLILLICFTVSVYFFVVNEYKYALGSIVIGVISAQTFYSTKYLKVLYRADNHFNNLAKIKLISTFVNLISLFIVYQYLFYGLCFRAIILALVDWYFTEKWKPLETKAKFNWEDFKVLSRVGMPIYFVANIYGLWPTFQRTLVLSMLGTKGLGIYALANIVQNMLMTFNNTISSISFPKMSLAYGQGKSITEVLKMPFKLILISLLIYTLILFTGWPLLPKVVEIVLPNYMAGVEAAQWMLLVALVSSFAVFSNIYMVIKKNQHRLISYSIGIGVWLLYILSHSVSSISDLVIFSKALLFGYIAITLCDFFFYY